MADELDDAMLENAEGPAEAADDAGSFKQHPIPDQIALAKYRAAQAAASTRRRGVRFNVLIPPGTSGRENGQGESSDGL
jgi:hypothetical protein